MLRFNLFYRKIEPTTYEKDNIKVVKMEGKSYRVLERNIKK
jgi:hypothetical protein